MTEPTYNKHLLSLTAIFILGDSIIVLPYADGFAPILGFLIASVLAMGFFFALYPIANFLLLKKEKGLILKAFSCVFLICAAVYAFYSAGHTFRRYLNFVDKVLLTDVHKFFIAAVFIILTVFLVSRRQEVILKLSLIFIFAAVLTVVLFFVFSFKDFQFKNIIIRSVPSFKQLYEDTLPYIKDIALPSLLIPVYSAIFTGKRKIAAPFLGLILGLLLVSVCLIDSILLFGVNLSASLDFPLSGAVSTVTVGPLFSRMDGIVYCLFFASALIKTSVCMKLCYFAVKRVNSQLDNQKQLR